jgi:hypothetical protein
MQTGNGLRQWCKSKWLMYDFATSLGGVVFFFFEEVAGRNFPGIDSKCMRIFGTTLLKTTFLIMISNIA